MKRQIILLSGHRGAGKDSAADYLVRRYGYVKLSIASILKDKVAAEYNIPRSWMDSQSRKQAILMEYPLRSGPEVDATANLIANWLRSECAELGGHLYHTPRSLLIMEGAIKRAIQPNYWVAQVARILQVDTENSYVIPDVRFRNEVDILQFTASETKLVRINRFGTESMDASERDLDQYKFDHVIENVGELEQLHSAVDNIIATKGA